MTRDPTDRERDYASENDQQDEDFDESETGREATGSADGERTGAGEAGASQRTRSKSTGRGNKSAGKTPSRTRRSSKERSTRESR